MNFAYVQPDDFFKLLDKGSSINSTGVTEFLHSLMFFEGTNYLYLYKPISGITYSTKMAFDDSGGLKFFSENVSDDLKSTIDNFKLKLLREYGAIEITQPLDIQFILALHQHDVHQHGAVGFDDIKL